MSKLFKMPTLGNGLTPDGDGNIIITKSMEGEAYFSIGPGISEIMLPDGTIVNVDPQGNILKDIVD